MNGSTLTICDLGRVVTGKTPSTNNSSFFDGEYRFVTPSDLDWRTYYCQTTERTVTDDARKCHPNHFIPGNAVMVTCIGNTIGKCGLSSSDCLTNQQINSIIPRDGIDPKFVYYLLVHNTDLIRGVGLGGGSATPILNKTSFSKIKLRVPPQHQWRKIGNTLSAYDDLIENNLRRIELLERSARLLYEEWFVRLRFPGHERVKIRNGAPDGWKKMPLSDICESVNYGYTASADDNKIGPKFLRITDIVPSVIDWARVPYCSIPDKLKAKFLLNQGDVVVARTGATTGYAKRIHKRHPEAIFASYLVRLRFMKDVDDMMIGIFMESDSYKNYIKSNVGGAAQPNANAKIMSRVTVLIPDFEIQNKFRAIIGPTFDQREILELQNQKLREARDVLLPRLMNGEIAL